MTDIEKTNIINDSLNYFKNNINYRWSDVLDYICDNWDLDNEWESLFKEYNNDPIQIGNFLILKFNNSIKYKL